MSSPGSPKTSHRFFVAVSPGLESFLTEELAALGITATALRGGVEARGTSEELWLACLRSRLAESVRVRLRPFVAKDFEALRSGLGRLPWHAYLPAGASVDVDVTCHHSRLWHSDAVAERTFGVLSERRGARPTEGAADEPTSRVFVRLERDEVQVSIDASGERLHRRGYRTHVAEASLRETLAAALVHAARRSGARGTALWDPFCGAGTILLEWLEMELGRSAGARRAFAFERWPTHDEGAYAELVSSLPSDAAPPPELRAFGTDVAERAILAARANAESAGLAEHFELIHGDFEASVARVPEGAWVISNPPYGVRLEEGDALGRLSRVLSKRRDLRPAVLLLGGGAKRFQSSLPFATCAKTKNGGLPVRIDVLAR